MKTKFVHLRIHTEFSISEGLLRISSLIKKAAAHHMPALAITDMGNLYAAVKFYQQAYKNGIKPLIGAHICVENKNPLPAFSQLTLLCQNNVGYKNLLKLISSSHLEGQINGKPVVTKSWIEQHAQGLLVLSGDKEGDIGQAIMCQDINLAQECLQYWQNLFPDRFYLEISRIGKANETEFNQTILKLAQKFSLPIVATNQVCFLESQDFEAHEARVCIHEGTKLEDGHRKRRFTEQQYFRTPEEMVQLFADLPEALANTIEIAKRCNVTFQLYKNLLPNFPVPNNKTAESYLCEIATLGLQARLTKNKNCTENDPLYSHYQNRLKRELDVINSMGFAGYFLIVADFTKWAKENGIPVGPGRGSGPGSLVAYCLNITDLDPLVFDLLFERFLNPERVSMPDFDIDFCIDGRDRVIDYVVEKHGHESVAQIITYGTMAAKAVVRDVGRVLGLPYGFIDKIAKLIPFELGMTLEKALQQEPLLQERYEQEEDVRSVIDLARKLEGVVRNVGKHAGGIVIAPGKLTDFVPLYREPNEAGHPVTQFDKDDVEAVGLVKFDFLGLKTLTIIDLTLRVLNDPNYSHHQTIDISTIPLDDAATFKLLKNCQSTAVFQLESHGMRDLIKRLQPDCFEDLIALVALFRPGPLQSGMVDDFINRKHGRAKVLYPHPQLEPILRPTYGVILYQEQVMQIAQVLAGYTLGAADILRRAMGKKKPEEMAKQRKIFCQGAKKTCAVNEELANHIFDLMEKFAGYGFNKSHSASYALIAYQTSWLKTHFPAAFMSAVLTSDMDKTEKILSLLNECQKLKVHVSPPDINASNYAFMVMDPQHLRYGLGAIKGVGEAAIVSILQAREKNGAFRSLFDFCCRVDLRKVNKRVLEALIKSGSFDSLNVHRASLMASIGKALQQAEQTLQNKTYGQQDLLSIFSEDPQVQTDITYVQTSPWSEQIQLQGEKETLGFYLTGHPINRFIQEFSQFTSCKLGDLHAHVNGTVCLAGLITNVRARQTKKGDRMAIFSLDDGSDAIDAICFADTFQKFRELISEDQLIIIEGEVTIDQFNQQPRIVCRELKTLDEARDKFGKLLQVTFTGSFSSLNLQSLEQYLTNHIGGKCPVLIRYTENNAQANIRLGHKWLVKPSETLLTWFEQECAAKVEVLY